MLRIVGVEVAVVSRVLEFVLSISCEEGKAVGIIVAFHDKCLTFDSI